MSPAASLKCDHAAVDQAVTNDEARAGQPDLVISVTTIVLVARIAE